MSTKVTINLDVSLSISVDPEAYLRRISARLEKKSYPGLTVNDNTIVIEGLNALQIANDVHTILMEEI